MPVNRISMSVTDAQKNSISSATTALAAAVAPFETVIEKEELKSLSKLGDIRIPCVEKVAQYAVSNPEFLQPFADVPAFNKDFGVFKDTREMLRPLRQAIDKLEATMQVSGSEAWNFARNYYKAVQYAAKMGVPGAQTILDDLRPLFEAKPKPTPTPVPHNP